MFKEQINKVKALITKDSNDYSNIKNDRKKIENLVFFLIILIITLMVIKTITNGNKKDNNESKESIYKELANESSSTISKGDELETRIEKILGTMSGVR